MVILAFASGLLVCASWPSRADACTSFAMSDGDHTLMGTNFDNDFKPGMLYVNKRGLRKTGLDPNDLSVTANWRSKYGSVTIHTAPYQYAWAGINEAGLAISTMQMKDTQVPPADDRASLMSAAWVQYVLDTCATIGEVVEAEKRVRLSYGVDHYLACDDSGDCLVIEFIEGTPVYHRGKEMPIKALANQSYAPCLEGIRSASRVGRDMSSVSRLSRIDRMVSSYDPKRSSTGIDYAFGILKEVSAPSTTWSLVFDLNERKLVFQTFENSRPRHIDLRALDFSCTTPVKMLDVHAKVAGDIVTYFQEYSRDATMQHALQAVRFHKPDIPEETVRQLVEHFEGFTCGDID